MCNKNGEFSVLFIRGKAFLWGAVFFLLVGYAHAQTYGRTEIRDYHDDFSKWVIGQQKKLTVNGVVASETTYDATYALPLVTKSFGKTTQTLTYDTTSSVASGQRGTLRTISDGNSNVSTLSSWKRGIPQLITYPGSTTQSASVLDSGWIAWVTDETGSRTCYTYDAIGRIIRVTYPSEASANTCNASTYTETIHSFTKSTAAKYGLPAGHWQQAINTGNGWQVTYLDALWRPVVVESFDNANANATRSLAVKRYDPAGRLVFQSYPMGSLSNYAATTLTGSHTSYDVLDRVTQVRQDWEGVGQLTTTTEYLAGFRTRVTDPRGNQTTTEYMAYDQPTHDWPVRISHPGGTFTDISRDAFGKPREIMRSGDAP